MRDSPRAASWPVGTWTVPVRGSVDRCGGVRATRRGAMLLPCTGHVSGHHRSGVSCPVGLDRGDGPLLGGAGLAGSRARHPRGGRWSLPGGGDAGGRQHRVRELPGDLGVGRLRFGSAWLWVRRGDDARICRCRCGDAVRWRERGRGDDGVTSPQDDSLAVRELRVVSTPAETLSKTSRPTRPASRLPPWTRA